MSSTFKISVIIPTLNEAENLRNLIPLLFSNGNKDWIEVIVADANSEGQTQSVAEQLGAKYVSFTIKSRAAQMNAGAKIARGEFLYFVHADTRPLASFVEDIKTNISKGYLAGCYRYRFDSDDFLFYAYPDICTMDRSLSVLILIAIGMRKCDSLRRGGGLGGFFHSNPNLILLHAIKRIHIFYLE